MMIKVDDASTEDGSVGQFIVDAIKGGWEIPPIVLEYMPYQDNPDGSRSQSMNGPMVLLDKTAWEAVGKARGWKEETWKNYWNGYYEALRDGLNPHTASDIWLV